MRILKKILIWISSILLALYIMAVAGLYFGQEKLIFPAEAVPQDTDYHFGDRATELWMSRDGGRLNALWTEPDSPKGVVLFFHGNGEILPRALPFALDLKTRNYAVLAPDYRGFGKSTGERTMENLYADALAWYDSLARHWPEDQIDIYGHSLGSGFATYVASQRNPSRLLLGAPYSSVEDVGAAQYPIMPVRLLLKFPFPSQEYIKEVRCPVHIIHGSADYIIPVSEGKELASLLPASQVHIKIIPHGSHAVMSYPEFWDWFEE